MTTGSFTLLTFDKHFPRSLIRGGDHLGVLVIEDKLLLASLGESEMLLLHNPLNGHADLGRLELLSDFWDFDLALILGPLRVLAVVDLVPDPQGGPPLVPGGVVGLSLPGLLGSEGKMLCSILDACMPLAFSYSKSCHL